MGLNKRLFTDKPNKPGRLWDHNLIEGEMFIYLVYLVCGSHRTTMKFNCNRHHSLVWITDLREITTWVY